MVSPSAGAIAAPILAPVYRLNFSMLKFFKRTGSAMVKLPWD